MKTPKCLFVILCLNVLPIKSEIADIYSAPLIELTQESCNNGLGFDKFQIESSNVRIMSFRQGVKWQI